MINFSPLKKENKNLLLNWLGKEHVKKFFHGKGLSNTIRNINLFVEGITHNGNYAFHHWIATIDDTPFAFLMTSPLEGPYNPNDDYNKWFNPKEPAITLDLLIGEEKFLGKGIAAPMIQQFLLAHFPTISTVLIDPAAINKRATHVYEKAGFEKVEIFYPQYDPTPHHMMHLKMKKLRTKQGMK